MNNVEKLYDCIKENDKDGELFERFLIFLEMCSHNRNDTLKELQIVI